MMTEHDSEVWFSTFMTLFADIFEPRSKAYTFSISSQTTRDTARDLEVRKASLIKFVGNSLRSLCKPSRADAFLVVNDEGDTLDVYLGPISAKAHCPKDGGIIPLYRLPQ